MKPLFCVLFFLMLQPVKAMPSGEGLRFAGEHSKLKLTLQQFEALFLQQNLRLLAEKAEIEIAEAAVIQAKLWDNPELSVSSVNLWSTDKQRGGEVERIPPLFGSFAKNTQFTVELSQLIQTANKRGKQVRREKAAKEMAKEAFEDLLRGLKTELRKAVYEAYHLHLYINLLEKQSASLEKLIHTYRKQVQEGNMAKTELLRLQSSLLEIENEINEATLTANEHQKTLKALINVSPLTRLTFDMDTEIQPVNPDHLLLTGLLDSSKETRPDIRYRKQTTLYYEKSWAYEKSLRVPDVILHANYDRYGGVWKDFVGFGFSVSLPFLNRNQGNIKAARFLTEQSRYLEEQQQRLAQNEIVEAYTNYRQAYLFFTKIKEDVFLSDLDEIYAVYTKNLLEKNISMLEFIDFMDTFRANKQIVLETQKKVNLLFEELQYATATELKVKPATE